MLQLSKTLPSLFLITALLTSCSQENSYQKHLPSGYQPPLAENTAKVAIASDPLSFDPRQVRDLVSINLSHALFEGLMRPHSGQTLSFGIAQSVDISQDKLTYTFTLRPADWQDGSPLAAADFIESWKSVLDPQFPSPNAHLLYVIKGAKGAKEGTAPLDNIGLAAPSPTTLIVELEQPTPYFLELLSSPVFFPVHPIMRTASNLSSKALISNGPFILADYKARNEVALVKNEHYWDAAAVQLEGLSFQVLEDNTALQLFRGEQLDWAGSPLSTLPQDAIASLKAKGELLIAPACGTHWFRFNTQKPPFNNLNMRKAFNFALDRQAIVDHITQGNQLPATSITPPSLQAVRHSFFKDHDTQEAKKSYMAGLIDLKNNKEKLADISLCYLSNDRNNKIAQAVQNQWAKAFGLLVKLEGCEAQVFYNKLRSSDYQIALGSWYADSLDPLNFLGLFKSKDNSTNNTGWEHPAYQALLNQSATANSKEERSELLRQAEALLLSEAPVAPLFYGSFNYLKQPRLDGALLLESGIIEFKHASIQK